MCSKKAESLELSAFFCIFALLVANNKKVRMTSIELDMIQTAGIGAMFADLINTGIVTLFLNIL